jgi:serine/threonine protein kinase
LRHDRSLQVSEGAGHVEARAEEENSVQYPENRQPEHVPAMEPEVPDLDDLKLAGEGPSGWVWVPQGWTGTPMVLYQHRTTDPEVQSALLEQLAPTVSLDHPHVIRTYKVWQERGSVWIACEFVSSHTLPTFVRHLADKPPVPQYEIWGVLAGVAEALSCAHERLVMHGGLEPGLIRVGKADYTAKVIGFGLQASGEERAEPQLFASRLPYRAPEMLEGAPASSVADQFSFGMIVAELSEAWPAAERENFRPVVTRATASRPEDRYADLAELMHHAATLLAKP